MDSAISRVQEAAREKGIIIDIKTFPKSTKTALEAAQVLGVSPGQIGKSLLFLSDSQPLLCIGAGSNRVEEKKIAKKVKEKVRLAKALEVQDLTGFSIGGVPPIGHPVALKTFIDEDLLAYEVIYCAAGTPFSVFPVTPKKLLDLTRGEVLDLKKE